MSEAPDFGDDDTGRIRTEAAKGPASDPDGALRGLATAFVAHDISDARRWKQLAALITLVGSLVAFVGTAAWSAHAQVTANTTQIESMQHQLDHIEAQIDRLVERTAP